MSRRFRPGLWLTAGAAALIALTVSAGNWQTRRAAEKAALEASYEARGRDPAVTLTGGAVDPEALALRRVRVRGAYRPADTVFVDNQVLRGVAGYHVITPLRIAGGERHVLVNRGWVATGPSRDVLPRVDTPEGTLEVRGLAVTPPRRVFRLGKDAATGPLRQGIDMEDLARRWRVDLLPVVILQESSEKDGLTRAWARPSAGVEVHRGYALQWYAFALLTLVFYVLLGFRRR